MDKINYHNDDAFDILIVDDVSENVKLLGDLLKNAGYKVRPVLSGLLALEIAKKVIPDMIILDIMMPEIDGIELCRQIKKDPQLHEIPVIFVTALSDTRNIVRALNAGGVDYIIKPFLHEEVVVRVSTHLKICQQKRIIQKQHQELLKLNEMIQVLKESRSKQ